MLKEVIVVEGKDDAAAIKRACKAEVIVTNGLGITPQTIRQIKKAQEVCGVIVFTDPDFPGEKIRGIINSHVPGCKHAHLERDFRQKGKIGVEYASPEEIIRALEKAEAHSYEISKLYTMEDLLEMGLVGSPEAAHRRAKLGESLGLGYVNGKKFLSRLNAYGISPADLGQALAQLGSDEG